ncbi:MAG TPA: serine/threonine-protein kinase [Pyrinomonadaceae bacterium]|nr:serine/threonine-protein kinase [Pyrinomonadaceae bacterium]
MTNEQWQLVKDIFSEAVELPVAERLAFVKQKSGGDKAVFKEVKMLLASDEEAEDFIENPAIAVSQLIDETSLIGQKIGVYLIEKEIGRGGMGAVYLASRADEQFQKQVAIKLIKRGFDTDEIIRRFRHERQILAAFDHPNITRLLDGGATENGLPYLVMDYVDGLPLNSYCEEKRLSINERLDLFLQICSAVTYAHQNLIIHRDIKPSNILVTADGVPKLLDFGIAKLTASGSPQTIERTGMQMLTPEYASPEQLLGQPVTTATDIYSLGIVLYELLTGQRPFKTQSNNPYEMTRLITDSEPRKPSSVVTREERIGNRKSAIGRQLRGDLDNIILMAMRKEPERRYSSVEQFAADINRYLKGLPVIAREDSFGYRASKFVQRNKAGVAAGVGIIASLVAGLIATKRQAKVTQRQRDKAQRINEFLQKMLGSADPQVAGKDVKVIEVLGIAAQSIEDDFASQPEIAADLHTTIGTTYLNLGLIESAEDHLQKALDLRLEYFPRRTAEVAVSLNNFGKLLQTKGDLNAAEPLYLEALKTFRFLKDDVNVARVLDNLGYLLALTGKKRESLRAHTEELEIRRALYGENHPDVAKTLGSLANAFGALGERDKTESLYRQALTILRKFYSEEHPDVIKGISRLASAVLLRDKSESERLYRKVLVLSRKTLGENHPDVAWTLYDLAFLNAECGDYAESEKLAREVLAMRGRGLTDEHPVTASAFLILGRSLLRQGRPEAAKPAIEECLALRRKTLGENHWLLSTANSFYGECLTLLGEREKGKKLLYKSYDVLREKLGADHAQTRAARERLRKFFPDAVI